MFDLFRKKTDLESFCGALTLEKVASQFEGSTDEDGFRRSSALLLLHAGHHFWQSLLESRELKTYVRATSADVVIFEVVVYVWSHLSLELEKMLADAGLDEDDPLSLALTDSLHISMTFFRKYLPDFDPKAVLKARLYPLNRLKSMEKFLSHLLSSLGQKVPTSLPQRSIELGSELSVQLHLTAHVGPFTAAYLVVPEDSPEPA